MKGGQRFVTNINYTRPKKKAFQKFQKNKRRTAVPYCVAIYIRLQSTGIKSFRKYDTEYRLRYSTFNRMVDISNYTYASKNYSNKGSKIV